jgi:hypothetical protein
VTNDQIQHVLSENNLTQVDELSSFRVTSKTTYIRGIDWKSGTLVYDSTKLLIKMPDRERAGRFIYIPLDQIEAIAVTPAAEA